MASAHRSVTTTLRERAVSTRIVGGHAAAAPCREHLDSTCVTTQTRPLHDVLRRRILGQDAVVKALTCACARLFSGLRDPGRPALTCLLLGPTGVGKTETARALAQAFFGSARRLTPINCEEDAHGHELSKLLGAPPGDVGPRAIVLFDEIEKAHPVL